MTPAEMHDYAKIIANRLEHGGQNQIVINQIISGRPLSVWEKDKIYCDFILSQLPLVFSECHNLNRLALYKALQEEEMFGEEHKYYVSLNCRREPDPLELIIFYKDRAIRFEQIFSKPIRDINPPPLPENFI